MSATQALKNQSYISMFGKLKADTETAVKEFIEKKGYKPPYWTLVLLATDAFEKQK